MVACSSKQSRFSCVRLTARCNQQATASLRGKHPSEKALQTRRNEGRGAGMTRAMYACLPRNGTQEKMPTCLKETRRVDELAQVTLDAVVIRTRHAESVIGVCYRWNRCRARVTNFVFGRCRRRVLLSVVLVTVGVRVVPVLASMRVCRLALILGVEHQSALYICLFSTKRTQRSYSTP